MTRILSGLILIVIVLGALFFLPPWGTLVVAAAACAGAAFELSLLAEAGGRRLPRALIVTAAVAVLVAAAAPWVPAPIPLLAGLVAMGCVLVGEARPEEDVVRRIGVMVLPMVYLALPLAAMVAIRQQFGAGLLLVLMGTTIVSDTAQYYGGRTMGRRPLAPRISPKKTVEGALTGIAVGSLVVPIAGSVLLPQAPVWLLWIVGLAVVGLGIAGDLFESLLKRSAGVKDSSSIIPGHGGVLDRIDSLLFAAPFYYGLLRTLA